jgi:hypothetical protein
MKDDLLPPASELAKLSDQQAVAVFELVDRANRREHSYALAALLCGTVSFLGVVAGFLYLVVQGHTQAAGVLLGAAVLAIVGQMIGSRLRN